MKRVFVCSPYSGDTARNIQYARFAMTDCFHRGEAPFAPHLLYTQPTVLDDDVPEQRELGIEAGLSFLRTCDSLAVYDDHGISVGMRKEIQLAILMHIPVEYRSLKAG